MDIVWTLLISLSVLVGAMFGLMIYVRFHYQEAVKKISAGKPQEALALFMKVVGWQSSHVPALWQLALLSLSMDKTEAAVKHLKKIVTIMDKEPDKAAAAARWEVTEAQAVSKLAWALAKLNQRADAVSYFRRLIQIEPNNKEALIESGKLLYALRDYDSCIGMFERAIALEPHHADCLELMSHAMAAKGEHGAAAEVLSRRLADERQNVNLWIRLANLYRTAKNNPKQAAAWRTVAEITPEDDPNHVSALVQRGKLAFFEKDYPAGLEILRRAEQLCSRDDERTIKTIKYYIGRALFDSGRKPEAMTPISEVYEMDPDYKDVRDMLRDSLELLSDNDLSEEIKKMRSDKFSSLAMSIVQLMGFRGVSTEMVNGGDLKVDAKLEETGKDRNVLFYFERGVNGEVGELAIRSFLIECDEKHVEYPVFLTTGGFTFEAQIKGKDHRMKLMPKHDFCELVRKMRTAA